MPRSRPRSPATAEINATHRGRSRFVEEFQRNRHRLLLYLAAGVVSLSVVVALGPRLLRATSGAPQPASRSPLPAGSSQLAPGDNPVGQAIGGVGAAPVTAPPPPVRRPGGVAPRRTR